MNKMLQTLRESEKLLYGLRGIYEQYGYDKFPMSKFEEYDFYTEHKEFLHSGQILTFTDLSGKLMALKPDVTMSIIKRTKATKDMPERLYYNESIYRAFAEEKAYKEIPQVGLEYIGSITPYVNAEIVNLALKSLSAIEEDCLIDISHMGFLKGLFLDLPEKAGLQKELLTCIETKNTHELKALCQRYSIKDDIAKTLIALITGSGPIKSALVSAKSIIRNKYMERAYNELSSIYDMFKDTGFANKIRIDFSITLDSKYYNGLMFRGYIKSAPRAVLSGGRYDNLLLRMGKEGLQAIGFALYFDEVERHLKRQEKRDYDGIVLYDDNDDQAILFKEVEKLYNKGMRIMVNKVLPPDFKKIKCFKLKQGKLVEENND